MAKNLLNQVMLKGASDKKKTFLDTDELIQKIQHGYIINRVD